MNNPRLAFRVGMKLVGLWAVLYSGTFLVQGLFQLVTAEFTGMFGLADTWQSTMMQLSTWFLPYLLLMSVGLYLIMSGQLVLSLAFAGGPGTCFECGYPMSQSQSRQCPECGAPRTAADRDPSDHVPQEPDGR